MSDALRSESVPTPTEPNPAMLKAMAEARKAVQPGAGVTDVKDLPTSSMGTLQPPQDTSKLRQDPEIPAPEHSKDIKMTNVIRGVQDGKPFLEMDFEIRAPSISSKGTSELHHR